MSQTKRLSANTE